MQENKEGLYEFDSKMIPAAAWEAFFRPAYIYTELCPAPELREWKGDENHE